LLHFAGFCGDAAFGSETIRENAAHSRSNPPAQRAPSPRFFGFLNFSAFQKAVHHFLLTDLMLSAHPHPARTSGRPRAPIPLRERLILAGLLVWFAVTLFWYRAGLDWTGHRVSAVLGLITFLIAFIPGGGRFPVSAAPAKRLLRFVPFWLGLVVLLYMAIQILNPAWTYRSLSGGLAAMVGLDHVGWLPSGVRVPVQADNNPYNGFLQVALPWMLFCIVAVGFDSIERPRRRRRKRSSAVVPSGASESCPDTEAPPAPGPYAFAPPSLPRAWSLLANGALLITGLWVLMALIHYYSGQTHLYGLIDIGRNNTPPFWGSMKNPRHGGYLQLLATALSLALAFQTLARRDQRATRSGLPWFYFCVAVFFSLATLQTFSRGASVLTLGLWLGAVVLGLLWGWRAKVPGLVPASLVFLGLVILGGGGFLALNLSGHGNRDFQSVMGKAISQWKGEGDVSRNILYRVGWRYHEAHPWTGTGIGSWGFFYRRHVAPGEEQVSMVRRGWLRDPETNQLLRHPKTDDRVPRMIPFQFWHAHNDWLQYLCELGWIGFTPLALLVLSPFALLFRSLFRSRAISAPNVRPTTFQLVLLAGYGLIVLASVVDFPTRTPALGLLAALLAGLAVLKR